MTPPTWWRPRWEVGGRDDPDLGWARSTSREAGDWAPATPFAAAPDYSARGPLEAQFAQVRSRDRVRSLAEVFTHQREVDAMLDLIPDALHALDVKFLEPSCGGGNFLAEILRRKLRLVSKRTCVSQEQYEHSLLRAVASIYGIDISRDNITEARGRMAHVVLEHYEDDANTIEPTTGFLNGAAAILGENIVVGDMLNAADQIELCDWQPRPGACFQRVWTFALIPPAERGLFWAARVQDQHPVHYSELTPAAKRASVTRRRSPTR